MCPGGTGKGVVGQVDANQGGKNKMKRFFHKFKETMGLAERTEFSKELSEAMEDMDRYKLCLDRLADAMCTQIQPNSKFRKIEKQMELAPPENQDEHDLVTLWLKSQKDFDDYSNKKIQIDIYQKMAIEHREYIRRARRALHNIRTFIQHDYWVVGLQRTELDELRAEMDFAKAELKAAKDPQLIELKNKIYNQAVTAFEEKLKQVTKSMDEVPKHKESHIADILEWANCTRLHHERMAKILEEGIK
ncbi:hypothetical protein Aduo_001279 [Ancylostoma duodenale]